MRSGREEERMFGTGKSGVSREVAVISVCALGLLLFKLLRVRDPGYFFII